MDLALRPEQAEIQRTFRDFVAREVAPVARALDESPRFPRELFERVGELGFFGMRYPEPLGTGADVVSAVLVVEELAAGSLSLAAACTMQSLMGTWFVHRFGTVEQRERLLVPALAGRAIGAICMTEPDAGSDLFAISTRAVAEGGTWRLTGSKTWVTSAPVADFFTVFARTGEDRLSVFLLERGAEGLEIGRAIEKAGVRSSLTSEVHLDGARATALLGEEGAGGGYLREILAEIRVVTAALAVGVGRAAYEEARRYAGERRQFGKLIERHPAVQEHLAEMATELEAARRLTHWAAWRSDQRLPNAREASMAKLFASEAANRIADRAARVTASYGYATDSPVQRYLRDARFVLIGGGTSEILRMNIAREG
ncbi:MAG: acyl-CoA dehydrogenase family protein [Polyangiaceae bacterium]|nr:acyl-CoA dehydrogenase family protein [Polyangiaceae bacterium]